MCNVTLRHEFHGSCVNLERNGEPSHLDDNDALDRLLYIVSHRQAANFFTRMGIRAFRMLTQSGKA